MRPRSAIDLHLAGSKVAPPYATYPSFGQLQLDSWQTESMNNGGVASLVAGTNIRSNSIQHCCPF